MIISATVSVVAGVLIGLWVVERELRRLVFDSGKPMAT